MIPILVASILTCTEGRIKIEYVEQITTLPSSIKQEVIQAIIESSPEGCFTDLNESND